jgi:hypothetical protein
MKGLVTSFPPTTATRSISFNRIAVLPKMFTDAEYTSAFLYQMKPVLIISISRSFPHKGTLEKFEYLLNQYFETDKPQTLGLPSFAYFASELNLSPGYFGDLIKKGNRQNRTGVYPVKID